MQSQLRHYPDWKAPSEDGKPLIWPQPEQILRDCTENQNRLSSADAVRLQKVPLPEIRSRLRQYLGHDDAQPLLANGHQSELYHPGVWVKDALIHAAAEKLNGQAYHIAVDSDAPKHLMLRWPGESIAITDDPNLASAAWCSQLSPPTPAHLDLIESKLRAASLNFQPALPDVLASLRRLSLESLDLSAALTNATHELDWQLGLRHHALLASPLWSSAAFLLFVHDLLANADNVASHYNAALETYRAQHSIRSHTRPMPDLFVSNQATEVPFWLDDLHLGRRSRPSVFASDRGWILKLIDGREFIFEKGIDGWESAARLQRWLTSTRHRISPRALMLTTFCRLLLADQFVHGIGGARYDQVTDLFIASHYQIEPPKFAVTTATMYLPSALDSDRVCVPCVRQEGHRLRHSVLGERKRELVAQIESLPRRSAERSARFFDMHAQLSAAARTSDAMNHWQQNLEQTREKEKQEQTFFDRELFYALQPRQRLAEMIDRYKMQFAL